MRATLPNNRIARILPVLRYVYQGAYQLEEGGKWWRPILGDIFE